MSQRTLYKVKEVQIHAFLTSVLGGVECSTSWQGKGKELPVLIEKGAGCPPLPQRAGLDPFLKRKSIAPAGTRTPGLPTCNLDITRLTLSDPVFMLEIKLAAIT
jgi:hypothetical protein